jgi:RNA polymerase sigma-70 factor (TIGR02960 family)
MMSSAPTDPDLLGRARSGDGNAFEQVVAPHRSELLLHCYRILGSVHDAEDLVQETLLSAWRGLDHFDGQSLRAWLYRIATNKCLNELRASGRRGQPAHRMTTPQPHESNEPWWLEPYPDVLIDESDPGPEALYESRESLALAFVAALQHLPARQRAALILKDAVGFSVGEVATILDTTTASVNSALQRARRDFHPPRDADLVPEPRSLEESAVVERFVNAFEGGDIDQVVALLTDDIRFTMPPEPIEYRGPSDIAAFIQSLGIWGKDIKLVPTRANAQPALGYYIHDPAAPLYRAIGLLVLALREDRIVRITRFGDRSLLSQIGLPRTLPDSENRRPD